MSWLYSRALVDQYWEGISLDGAQCALWNGTPTRPPSWCNDKTMAACRVSRSGIPFRPLVDDHGEAVLTSYLEAFPVQTSPVLEEERESRESNPPCGSTWRELSMKCVREKGYSSKIVQCLLWAEELEPSCVTLPKWGMMQDGELWERITLPPLTSATGSGLWPTPTASEDAAGTPKGKMQAMLGNHPDIRGTTQKDWNRGSLNPTWVEAYLMRWPVAWTSMEPLPKEVFQEWERGFLTGSIDSSASATDKSHNVQP